MSFLESDNKLDVLKKLDGSIQLEESQFCGANVWKLKEDQFYGEIDFLVNEWIKAYDFCIKHFNKDSTGFAFSWFPVQYFKFYTLYNNKSYLVMASIIHNYLIPFPKLYLPFAVCLYEKYPQVFESEYLFVGFDFQSNITEEMLRGLCSVVLEITKRMKHGYVGISRNDCGFCMNFVYGLYSSPFGGNVYREILACVMYVYNNIKRNFDLENDVAICLNRQFHNQYFRNRVMREYILYLQLNLEELHALLLHFKYVMDRIPLNFVSRLLGLVDYEILCKEFNALCKRYQYKNMELDQLNFVIRVLFGFAGFIPKRNHGIPIFNVDNYVDNVCKFEKIDPFHYGVVLFRFLCRGVWGNKEWNRVKWIDAVANDDDVKAIGFDDFGIIGCKRNTNICSWSSHDIRMDTVNIALTLYAVKQLTDLSSSFIVNKLLEREGRIKFTIRRQYKMKNAAIVGLLALYDMQKDLSGDLRFNFCKFILDVDKLDEDIELNTCLTTLSENLRALECEVRKLKRSNAEKDKMISELQSEVEQLEHDSRESAKKSEQAKDNLSAQVIRGCSVEKPPSPRSRSRSI